MPRWVFVALLVLGAHFGASYLVPLDREAQQTFGGLLKWAWPWADGDSGPFGRVTVSSGFPLSGFFLAVTSASLFFLAALGIAEFWVPFRWWRWSAFAAALLSVILMALFFGPRKLIPMALDLFVLRAAWKNSLLRARTAPTGCR